MKKFSPEESKRFLTLLKKVCAVLGAGIAYLLFTELTGWGIPCVLFQTTGIYCPGCGISRMLMALIRLDFVSAFHYNPAVLLTSPILLFFLIRSDIGYIRTGKSSVNKYNFVWIAELVILLAFGVVRNLL